MGEGIGRRAFRLPVLQLTRRHSTFKESAGSVSPEAFDDKYVARFTSLMMQFTALGTSPGQHKQPLLASSFTTLGTLIGYPQSRRRASVSLLHRPPNARTGAVLVRPVDPVVVFFPIIEPHAIPSPPHALRC